MPKAVTEIRSLARSHTRTALNVLVAVMRNTKVTPPARGAAANAILDRGWGKPTQAIGNDDSALELIHRIERVILHHLYSKLVAALAFRLSRRAAGEEQGSGAAMMWIEALPGDPVP
jgi:hypothetical protein